jgi:hypothetical protein
MIKHIHSDIYAVEVEEGAYDIEVHGGDHLVWNTKIGYGYKLIPPGKWKYLCLNTTQKEEEAAGVCEFWTEDAEGQITHWSEFKNYNGKEWYCTAVESLSSMNKAFELSGTWALIQKLK